MSDLKALPLRGVKRKIAKDSATTSKKLRRSPSLTHDASDSSDSSNSSSQDNLSEDESTPPTVPTPSTPVSSRASPRYPSDHKNQHCPYDDCSKSFNRQSRLTEHIRSHTNTRPFVCPHAPCTKDFRRESHLSHHIKSVHTDVRDHVCQWDGCGKTFVTATRLRRHYAAHEGREKFRCPVAGCGQTFRKHNTLQKHTAIEHEGKKPFVCARTNAEGQICGQGFDNAGKLKTHEGRIHGDNKFTCTICVNEEFETTIDGTGGQVTLFSTYADLQAHNKEVHPPVCTECGLKCSSPRDLTRHTDIQHGGQDLSERRVHACTVSNCDRSFTKRGNLLVHLRNVHDDEKGFVCGTVDISSSKTVSDWNGENACGRGFKTKQNLEDHIRSAHMGLDRARKMKAKALEQVKQNYTSRRKKRNPAAVSRLIGSAYDEDPGRRIPCLQAGCPVRFIREYDLDIHLQSAHGLADFEIQLLRAAHDETRPSIYGYELATDRNAMDMEAETALDVQFGNFDPDGGLMDGAYGDLADDIEEAAARGGQFWVGGGGYEVDMGVGEEWEREEMEMQRLIAGDREAGGERERDEMMIDPVLR